MNQEEKNNLEIENDLEIENNENSEELEKEESYNQEALESLLEFDFSSDQEFDIDGNYKHVDEFIKLQEKQKVSKEDKIIENLGSKYIDKELYKKIEGLRDNIKSFMKRYSAESEYVKSLLDDYDNKSPEIDKIYAILTFLKNTFKETLDNLVFVFQFNREEYNFIVDALKNTQLNGNEVLLEGMDEMLSYINEWKKVYDETDKDTKILNLPLSIGSTVLLYHFLSKKTVKTNSRGFNILRSIMFGLKECNDLHQAYNTISERLNQEYMNWTGSVTPLNQEKSDNSSEKVDDNDKEIENY